MSKSIILYSRLDYELLGNLSHILIARIHIQLPFALVLPETEQYPHYEYSSGEYGIRIFPPEWSDRADSHSDTEEITINGIRAINADVLRIDFQKDNFERAQSSECDPPFGLIIKTANSFLARLRYVTNASQIKLLEFPHVTWKLRYLNDDETELPEKDGYVRGKGGIKFHLTSIALTRQVWEDVLSIHSRQDLPVWRSLLLDAHSLLPEIGPSIVLAFAALEVFISKILDEVVVSSEFNIILWDWINDSKRFLKNPSVGEKFDFLSKLLIGNSLKDDHGLWEAFIDLRKARNSFAHEGVAMIGDEIVTQERARILVIKATEIIEFFKKELPTELTWPEFNHEITTEFVNRVVKLGRVGS